MSRLRIIVAFLIAPLIPSGFFIAILGFRDGGALRPVITASLIIGYFATAFFGGLVLFLNQRLRRLSLWEAVLMGAVGGFVLIYLNGAIWAVLLDSSRGLLPQLQELIWGALFGSAVSFSFCVISGVCTADVCKSSSPPDL